MYQDNYEALTSPEDCLRLDYQLKIHSCLFYQLKHVNWTYLFLSCLKNFVVTLLIPNIWSHSHKHLPWRQFLSTYERVHYVFVFFNFLLKLVLVTFFFFLQALNYSLSQKEISIIDFNDCISGIWHNFRKLTVLHARQLRIWFDLSTV